jgi:hypothetical protein
MYWDATPVGTISQWHRPASMVNLSSSGCGRRSSRSTMPGMDHDEVDAPRDRFLHYIQRPDS